MSLPNIEILDADGAIREAEEKVAGDTRASFFRKAAVGGGAALSSGAILGMLPEMAMAKPSKKQDIEILNYALTLEFLEAEFYREAVRKGDIRGDALQLAKLVFKHEDIHVKTLQKVIKSLGGNPVNKPKFDFKGTNREQKVFIDTALVLENTGVHAYLGQAKRLKSKALLTAAGSILTVEARHAGAFAVVNNEKEFTDKVATSITPDGAFDVPFSMKKVLAAVGDTGFIKG
jgi:rubrerythrin